MQDFPRIPLVTELTLDQRKETTILFDCEAVRDEQGRSRIDLNVVFTPIPVRRGIFTEADYYIANRGADIVVSTSGGRIVEHTPEAKLDVNYSQSKSSQTEWKFNLGAKLTSEGDEEKAIEFSPVENTRVKSVSYTTSFSSHESLLTVIFTRDTIGWNISLPKASGAIRDFLHGNLYLFAVCDWNGQEQRRGRIELRPSDVSFFNANKEQLSSTKSMVMWLLLRKRGIKVRFGSGFGTGFGGL